MTTQIVRTSPRKVFKEKYLTKKGLKLKAEGASKEVLSNYEKNRYIINRASKQLKKIKHLN